MEHFVKITHSEEQHRIGMLRLNLGVLIEHSSL
jgi:hypothetical protein